MFSVFVTYPKIIAKKAGGKLLEGMDVFMEWIAEMFSWAYAFSQTPQIMYIN